MQIFAVSEVSGGPYCNCNLNSGTETNAADLILHISSSDNFKQSRNRCLVYLMQMINSGGLHAVKW